ncbi:MAG: hypothetical protein VKP62_16735 [Candidatus Sericytochromatia bacterium]|nr:hypothetical protein [Candidatus Sericytochromatia bacterium]
MTTEPSPDTVTITLTRDQVQPLLDAIEDAINLLHLSFNGEDDDDGVEVQRIERVQRNLLALNSLEFKLESLHNPRNAR